MVSKCTHPLSPHLDENLAALDALFKGDSDFIVRRFVLPADGQRAALLFFDGLVNADLIGEQILQPLLTVPACGPVTHMGRLSDSLLPAGEIAAGGSLEALCDACLLGDAALLIDGVAEYLAVNAKGFERRAVQEPQTETVVRGPREGFTETLRVNTALVRRRLKTPALRAEMHTLGRRTRTPVCLMWLDGIAGEALLREVRARLKTIDTDAILNSGYIEAFIENAPRSIFQTMAYTEKPDIVAAKLLEGRCALIIDGTPFVLTMPMLFVECFQSPEDYTMRPHIATFLRLIRALAFVMSLCAPAMYIALTTFHQELIPTTLLFTIAAASESVPFTRAVETAIMLVTFEVLKEAGVRLPKPIGQAVSIVGALVMGQAAIQAGVVGAPVVIVIAFSAMGGFLIPSLSDATSLLRWYLLGLAAVLGGFGIVLGLMTILLHLASLESFGAVYLHPMAPLHTPGLLDTLIRVPLWKLKRRPAGLRPQEAVRTASGEPAFGPSAENDP